MITIKPKPPLTQDDFPGLSPRVRDMLTDMSAASVYDASAADAHFSLRKFLGSMDAALVLARRWILSSVVGRPALEDGLKKVENSIRYHALVAGADYLISENPSLIFGRDVNLSEDLLGGGRSDLQPRCTRSFEWKKGDFRNIVSDSEVHSRSCFPGNQGIEARRQRSFAPGSFAGMERSDDSIRG